MIYKQPRENNISVVVIKSLIFICTVWVYTLTVIFAIGYKLKFNRMMSAVIKYNEKKIVESYVGEWFN